MNTFESNIQESVNTLITPHEETERISEQVYHQDDTNNEQVETSNIASQNLESEDSTTSLCIGHTYRSWNDVDVVMKTYVQFLTEHENLPITTQRKLLKAKFLTISILDVDLTNAIQKYKVKPDVEHDASYLLKILIEHKSNDPGWFVEFQLDQENRLTWLYWMSPTQIALWLEYHDVILNDNTAKTNRYNMPLSLFLAVDNNTRSHLVA
ncbi:unnamed protein product [Rhizophagus irregularis]|nr:unnamed protein product [Rhizophagus irregularis]